MRAVHLRVIAGVLLLGVTVVRGDAPPTARPADTAQAASATPPQAVGVGQTEVSPVVTVTPSALPDVPVVVGGRELFRLSTYVGSFSPADRAAAITGRIERLARDPMLRGFEVTVQPTDDGAAILCEGAILMVVTGADASVRGVSPVELAGTWARAITVAIREGHVPYNLRSLALGAGGALLATLILVLILKVLARVLPRASTRVDSWRGRHIPSLRIQKLEILSADRIADLLLVLVRLVRAAVVILCLYAYFPLVLGLFPWTKGLSHTLFGYLLTPLQAAGQAAVAFLPDLFFLVVIGVLTHYGLRGIRFVFREIGKGSIIIPGLGADVAEQTYKIVRFLILVFALIVAFPYLPGSDSKAFQGVSLFLGVLFSLGSSSAIANIVAGVILTYTGAFRLGDRVKIADTVGDVIEKTLLVTRVRTIKNVEITIPNGMVLSSHIVNYSAAARQTGLILHTTVTIGYDAPWRQVHDLLTAGGAPHRGDPRRTGAIRAAALAGRLLPELRAQRVHERPVEHGADLLGAAREHPGLLQRGGRGDHVARLPSGPRRQPGDGPGQLPAAHLPGPFVPCRTGAGTDRRYAGHRQ